MSRLRADTLTDRTGTSAPDLTHGATSTTGTFSGDLGGGNVTLSGNATVDGTLTYQDADNINSTGIITARQGIQVLANGFDVTGISTFNSPITVAGITTINDSGLHATGVVTATSFAGDGSALTGTNRTVSLVASGTLSNGQTVIVTSDGKAAGVTTTGFTESLGSETTVLSSSTGGNPGGNILYDSTNNKIVIAFQDSGDSGKGKAFVGTVSGTSITFGSAVTLPNSTVGHVRIGGNDSGQVVIVFKDFGNGDVATAIAGNISGDSINFGTKVTVLTGVGYPGGCIYPDIVYDSNADKYVMVGKVASNGNIICKVLSVSGTTITMGSEVNVFNLGGMDEPRIEYDPVNKKVVIIAQRSGGSKAIVGTVSGTSISFGSAVDYESGQGFHPDITYDASAGAMLITFSDDGDSYKSKLIAGTVSGTSISFGSPVIYASGTNYSRANALAYNAASRTNSVFFQDYGSSGQPGKYLQATVSGTTVTINTAQTFNSGSGGPSGFGVAYDSTNKVTVTSYIRTNNSNYGSAIVFRSPYVETNLLSTNFIGFSDAAYSDGATANIQIEGSVDDAQTGLTTAKLHYVQNDGSLSTTAGTPSVVAGIAITDTKIIVKG